MRSTFASALCELASADSRVFLLTADLGYRVLEPFADQFSDRFVNVGVAEQNMLGIATGLALEGLRPFVYSIASFATTRCLEQIRLGPVLHRMPVCIVGTGAGFAYGSAGPTHYVHEDVVAMRAQPGMRIFAPITPGQMHAAVRQIGGCPGPSYLRIGQDGIDLPEPNERSAEWHDTLTFGQGGDVELYTWGSITEEVCASARLLGSGTRVIALQSLGLPAPQLQVGRAARLRVEESMPGCSVYTDTPVAGAPGLYLDDPLAWSSSPAEHRRRQGLDRHRIVRAARRQMANRSIEERGGSGD